MNGELILDTSVVIKLFGNNKTVINKITGVKKIHIPVIVFGELFYGAMNSKQIDSNIEKLNQFFLMTECLKCDFNTGKFYGEIKNNLKRVGKPIPENDIWIAALSMQHNIPIATSDKHFQCVENLKYFLW